MWIKIIVIKRGHANHLFHIPFWEGEEGDLEMLQDTITVFYFVSLSNIPIWISFLKNYAKNPLL